MKLYKYWGLWFIAYLLSMASFYIWPRMEKLGLTEKEDWLTAILFKPFHYILGVLFLLFVIMILTVIARKIIYECKVAYLFKAIPYESSILLVLSAFVYFQLLRFKLILSLIFTICFTAFHLLDYYVYQKREKEYVRE